MASILKGPRQLPIKMLFSRLYLNLPNSSTRCSINGIACCSHRSISNHSHGATESSKDQNRLIYEGPLMSKVKSIKLLSLTTSIAGLVAQTYIYSKSLQEGSNISTLTLIISSTMVLAFSLTPLLLNSITKRYVYQLYFNPSDKSLTAYTLNLLNQPVKTHFTKSTLELAPVASPFTTILVNKKPLFVDLKEIKDPEALELFV